MVAGYQRETDVTMSLAMDAVKGSEVRSDSFVIPPGAMSSKTGEKILTVVTVFPVCKSTRAQCHVVRVTHAHSGWTYVRGNISR